MAMNALNTENAIWTTAQNNLRVANLAWTAVDLEDNCPAREAIAKTLDEARVSLFSAPAPTISAVIEKLSLWWGEALWDESYESHQNRIVIGDLRRIALQNAGVEASEASGSSPKETADLPRRGEQRWLTMTTSSECW